MVIFVIAILTIHLLGAALLFDLYLRDPERATKYAKRYWHLIAAAVFELGKALFTGALIGMYFIPEPKDFTAALICGIIFFIGGFLLKPKNED